MARSTQPLGIAQRNAMVITEKLTLVAAVILICATVAPAQDRTDRLAPYIAWATAEGNEVTQALDFTKHLGFGDRQITTIGIAMKAQFEKSDGLYLFEVVKGSEPANVIVSFVAAGKGIAWRVTKTGEISAVLTSRRDGDGNVQFFDIPKEKWQSSETLFTQQLQFWDKTLPEKYRSFKRNP